MVPTLRVTSLVLMSLAVTAVPGLMPAPERALPTNTPSSEFKLIVVAPAMKLEVSESEEDTTVTPWPAVIFAEVAVLSVT